LAQRFPEVASGYVKLTDIESVRRVARVYYQDDLNGEKAIELLTYAMEYQSKEQRDGRRNEPPDQKLWLALFDLYRLESRATEYVSLAARYRKAFPKDDKYHWPRIAKDGARLDPTYAPFAPFASDEEDDDMDSPWLGSTLDMTGAVLSRELRDALREPGSVAVAYFHVAP
jgi:hypothetical protein